MAAVAEKYQSQLKRLKNCVEDSRKYMEKNYKRFTESRRFVYASTMTNDDISVLKTLGKPQIECNTLEAFISRQVGEFAKQEPSLTVASNEITPVGVETVEVVEAHIRAELFDASNDSFEWKIYEDMLSGGYSCIEMWTTYENERSFEQVIKCGRVFDPTMIGFDPLARESHKGDGRYFFKLYPKTKEDFEAENPNIDIKDIKFTREDNAGFNWSYESGNDKILLICDFYEKKKKKVKILLRSDGSVKTQDEHDSDIEQMMQGIQTGQILKQPPVVVDERWTEVESICRYRFIENQVLEYVMTDFKFFPLIFADGNSKDIQLSEGEPSKLMTRPSIYNAIGMQKFMNFALQCWGNELENSIAHKLKVPKEGIPNGYEKAYINNQVPSVIVYNAYKDDDPNVPLPPPEVIVRPAMPPEIVQAFEIAQNSMQNILGSFDAALGINGNQISGAAIIEGATNSNAASMPYVMGFIKAFNQLANIYVDLLPKYYKTPRTIPIKKKDGTSSYIEINAQDGSGVQFNYPENALKVRVETGVNFAVQKAKALQQIVALSQAMPAFGQFMNAKGLKVLLSNLEIKGVDLLELMADEYMKELQQQQQMQQQMMMQQHQAQMQNNPLMIKQQELQVKQQQNQAQNALDLAKLQNDNIQIQLEAASEHQDRLVEAAKIQAENLKNSAQFGLQSRDQLHQHTKDAIELTHNIMQDHTNNAMQQQQMEQQAQQSQQQNQSSEGA
jgi:hypothetical protein